MASSSFFLSGLQRGELKTIVINWERLSDATPTDLHHALKNNRSLEALQVTGQIGDAHAIAIVTALEGNAVLRILHLEGGTLTDAVAPALARFLENTPALVSFGFERHQLTDTGCLQIIRALHRNSLLQCFRLGGNQTTERAQTELLDVMKTNTTILDLSLDFNGVRSLVIEDRALVNRTNQIFRGLSLLEILLFVLKEAQQATK